MRRIAMAKAGFRPSNRKQPPCPARCMQVYKKREEPLAPTPEVTINLPIKLRGLQLPKDVDPVVLGKEVAELLNRYDDGHRNVGTESLERIVELMANQAAYRLIKAALDKRYKPRMIATGPGAVSNNHGVIASERVKNLCVHVTCGEAELVGGETELDT